MPQLWASTRVVAIKSRRSGNAPAPVLENDWLGHLIDLTKVVAGAGELVGLPYIKGSAAIIQALLEPIQKMQKNQDNFRDLAESMVGIIMLLRDEILAHPGDYLNSQPSRFVELCGDFNEHLLEILEEMNQIAKTTQQNWLKRYWTSASFADMITRHEKRLNSLRNNLVAATVVANRMRLEDIHKKVVQDEKPPNDHLDLQSFREIRRGDINRRDKGSNKSYGFEEKERYSTIEYTAKINDGTYTVRYYKGNKSLEAWKEHLQLYSQLCHPWIFQLFGFVKEPDHLALVFHDAHFNLKAYASTLKAMERVAFIYRMTLDNQSAWSYLKEHFTPPEDVNQNIYHYGHVGSSSYRTLVNSERRICISIEDKNNRKANSWRSAYPLFPVSSLQVDRIQDQMLNLIRPGVDRMALKIYLSTFNDMVANIITQERLFNPASMTGQFILLGVYLGWDRYSWGRIAFTGKANSRPLSAPWFVDDTGTSPQCHNVGNWTRFTILRSSSEGPNIITAKTRMIDSRKKNQSRAWTAQANHLLSVIERTAQNDVGLLQRLTLVINVAGQLQFDATFRESTVLPKLREVYLFIRNLEALEDGTIVFPDVYWSTDPQGNNRMSSLVLELLGLQSSLRPFKMRTLMQRWTEYHWEALRQAYVICGFDPESSDVARLLGFQAAHFIPAPPLMKRARSLALKDESKRPPRRRGRSLEHDRDVQQ